MISTTRHLALWVFTGLAACDTAQGQTDETPAPEAAAKEDEKPSAIQGEVDEKTLEKLDDKAVALAPAEEHTGQFVFKFVAAKDPKHKPYEALFQHGRLSSLVGVMKLIRLPRSVPVVPLECGTPNAFYTPTKHGVVLCYELAHQFYTKFASAGADPQKASDQTLNALTFVLLHEMGHAVVGELELGVTGGEEDAVDDLAALLLVDAKQPAWAVDGAMSMAMLDAGAKPAYFDEHSIGEQRFYNITCIVYGSAPQQYGALVERGVLPERRAARCMKEYTQKNKAWEDLLRPHIRK